MSWWHRQHEILFGQTTPSKEPRRQGKTTRVSCLTDEIRYQQDWRNHLVGMKRTKLPTLPFQYSPTFRV